MSDTMGGEKPGRRRAVEKMTGLLRESTGMTRDQANEKAREIAKRNERGAIKKR